VAGGRTRFRVDLPPFGSAFVTAAPSPGIRVVAADFIVQSVSEDEVASRVRGGSTSAGVRRGEQELRLCVDAGESSEPLVLDGEWEWIAEDANALVIREWHVTAEAPDTPPAAYAAPEIDVTGWRRMVPGAWAYQLPAEPVDPYPIPVWYRIGFEVTDLPPKLNLIVDGFTGSDWRVLVNGEAVASQPVRSTIDSQMHALDITRHVVAGDNMIALRLTVTKATDGLLDLVKLTGDFAVERAADHELVAARPATMRPAPWTEQGYPYFSGSGVYRRRFDLPEAFAGQRIVLEPDLADDVLEVVVNGRHAGVRLWPPYDVEVTGYLQPGENLLDLRVANTLINLLEAVPRPSGLSGPPRLTPYRPVNLSIPPEAQGTMSS